MEISSSGRDVLIKGNIKSVGDFQKIKNFIDNLITTNNSLSIHIEDSISITSSVIGYFTKILYKDNIQLNIVVSDERLYELLDELGLVSQFSVRQA